jgi:hypothetical protein
MPNLTPIPLTIEEHERLIAMKHRLEAGSWREMIMKLCDICEELYKTGQPFKTDQPTSQETKPARPEPKKGSLPSLFSQLGKEGEKIMNEENIRRIIREELQDHKFEVELPKQEEKPKEKLEPCPDCGTPTKMTWKHCPNCGEEFDDAIETEE